jgi:hypothetical protein
MLLRLIVSFSVYGLGSLLLYLAGWDGLSGWRGSGARGIVFMSAILAPALLEKIREKNR